MLGETSGEGGDCFVVYFQELHGDGVVVGKVVEEVQDFYYRYRLRFGLLLFLVNLVLLFHFTLLGLFFLEGLLPFVEVAPQHAQQR